MWWWWYFTCVHQYFCLQASINIKNVYEPSMNNIKHVVLHDYFLHMWNTPRVINYEPNEHKQLATW
jgi:hypothetical protein